MEHNNDYEIGKTFTIQEIINNPVEAYKTLHARLLKFGANAPFPEFKPAVEAIINAISGPKFDEVFIAHPDLLMEKREVMTVFTHLNLTFFFDDPNGTHPYQIPFDHPYPYRPTLEAIELGLKLLDKLNRFEPGNRAVPFYHFDRYAYHKFGIFGNSDVVIMPIAQEIDFFDLLRIRSVPIGFLGVVTETIRVDRHWQSPLDFWYHDINHVRRMVEYFNLRIREQGIENEQDKKYEYYQAMDDFLTEKIVPFIQNLKGVSEKDFALRKMLQILVFEVVHESALTAESAVILKEIMRGAGPQPFEHMISDLKVSDIEQFRTPTGNVASGISVVEADPLQTLSIRYFFDRSLGFLSTVFNKLNFGFYDDPENPNDMVVPVKYRTVECVTDAVFMLYELCGVSKEDLPEQQVVIDLITDREGSHEKYVYKGVMVDEKSNHNIGSYATDPLPVRLVIREIHNLQKKVCLFMGYSELGYENESTMLSIVREKLSELNPEEYIVCIGATSQGIGQAYKVAQEMGFETIGIVSTLALSSAGSFSPCVDRIYIVNDNQWGGYIPGTALAAATTRAFLETADVVHAIGGGHNTEALLQIAIAQYFDVKVTYTPADMDHRKATRKGLDPAGLASKVSLTRIHKQ